MPKKIRRFFYVGTGKSDIIHMSSAPHFVDGESTWCGTYIRAGWKYWLGLRSVPKGSAICAKCAAQR